MKTTSIVLVVTALALQSTRAQDSLTVEQAVRKALESHPAVEQAHWNLQASEARALQSTVSRYPTASAEAFYTRLGPVAALSIPVLGDFKLYPENNYDAHIGARYTLYDFGRTDAAFDLSSSRIRTSEDAVELTKTGLTFQTIRTFYAMLLLTKSLRVQDEQIEALEAHLAITEKKLAAGTTTSFDVLTTRVRVAQAQNQKIDLENTLEHQEALMRQLLSLPPGSPVALKGEFRQYGLAFNSDSLIELALAQRTEAKLVRDAEKSAQLQYRVASLGRAPSLKLSANYGLKNGFIPNIDVLRGNYAAGMQIEVPILDGKRMEYQEEESEAILRAEESRRKDVEQQIRADVEQGVADAKAALGKLRITDLQLQQANEAVALARSRYENGTLTNLDLLDAEAAESAAKLGSLQALYKLIISRFEQLRSVGTDPLAAD